MSETEHEQEAPSVGQSELDLLIEIRDLLKELLKRNPGVTYTSPQGLPG